MLEMNTEIPPKATVWLRMHQQCITLLESALQAKWKRKEWNATQNAQECQQTLSFPGPPLPLLSVQSQQDFLPHWCVLERGVSTWTCPIALRASRHVMPTVLHAHADQMRSAPTSLTVISWALYFTFNYHKFVKKKEKNNKPKTNHTHKKNQTKTQEIQIYSQPFERLTIPYTHIHMLVKQPFKVVGVVSYKSSI